MRGLEKKAVLVCGGASGIGAATVRRLCDEGARVAIGDLDLDRAEALAVECRAEGLACRAWGYDQSDPITVEQLVQGALGWTGRLDGLFANVADLGIVLEDVDILSNPAAVWERTACVNVTGTATLIRAALPHMIDAGSGSIVCTSSAASVLGERERPAYGASKAAIGALCRHVASKWGRAGIRCNAVAPGLVMTEMVEVNLSQTEKELALKLSNSFRLGMPQDIAATVAFLLSEDAEWINGQVWHVNGGVYYGQ